MRKLITLLFFISSIAWSANTCPEDEICPTTESSDSSMATNKSIGQIQEHRHSISVGYSFLTIFDFATGIASIFDSSIESYGAVSIAYGYKTGSVFETGAIFNYELTNFDAQLFTVMGRAKFNLVNKKYVRYYVDFDFGFSLGVKFADEGSDYESSSNEYAWIPMGHISLLGLEFGDDISFFIQTFGWGQLGLVYGGLKFAF